MAEELEPGLFGPVGLRRREVLKLGQVGAVAERQSALHVDGAEALRAIGRIGSWSGDGAEWQAAYLVVSLNFLRVTLME